jgi:hypothetical protein
LSSYEENEEARCSFMAFQTIVRNMDLNG